MMETKHKTIRSKNACRLLLIQWDKKLACDGNLQTIYKSLCWFHKSMARKLFNFLFPTNNECIEPCRTNAIAQTFQIQTTTILQPLRFNSAPFRIQTLTTKIHRQTGRPSQIATPRRPSIGQARPQGIDNR